MIIKRKDVHKLLYGDIGKVREAIENFVAVNTEAEGTSYEPYCIIASKAKEMDYPLYISVKQWYDKPTFWFWLMASYEANWQLFPHKDTVRRESIEDHIENFSFRKKDVYFYTGEWLEYTNIEGATLTDDITSNNSKWVDKKITQLSGVSGSKQYIRFLKQLKEKCLLGNDLLYCDFWKERFRTRWYYVSPKFFPLYYWSITGIFDNPFGIYDWGKIKVIEADDEWDPDSYFALLRKIFSKSRFSVNPNGTWNSSTNKYMFIWPEGNKEFVDNEFYRAYMSWLRKPAKHKDLKKLHAKLQGDAHN